VCRAHIQAHKLAIRLNTQLTDRVSQGSGTHFDDEEKRDEFDIHKYSSRVIEMAQDEMIKSKSKTKVWI
jgi:hypothetical protein